MPDRYRFVALLTIVILQIAAALYVPLRGTIIRSTGRQVSLQLAPVDPYSLLTGYSLDLSYKVSRLDSYPPRRSAPKVGDTVFAILRHERGSVWSPVSLETSRPSRLDANEVFLKGVYERRGWTDGLWFGIEKLYIPAERRDAANAQIQEFTSRIRTDNSSTSGVELPPEFARADVVVDAEGNASLLRLHLGENRYP